MRYVVGSIAALVISSCALFAPETGSFQGEREAGAPSSNAYGSPPEGGGPDPRCLHDGGFVDNACDLCENAGCCATRFGCYDDPTCAAANKAFDACLAAASDGGSPSDVAACWSTLSASTPVARARVDCQRAKCQTECAVP